MNVWCVYAFILSLCSPTVCKMIKKLINQPCAPKWEREDGKKKRNRAQSNIN
jgi:trehalose utilization protein